jgi:hypothetical protein
MSDRSYRRRLRLASGATAFFLLLVTVLSIASLGNTAPMPDNKADPSRSVELPDEAPAGGTGSPGVPVAIARIWDPGEVTWIAFKNPGMMLPGMK